MCTKCSKNSCGGGCGNGNSASNSGNSTEQLANQLAELATTVTQLQADTKAFACGHPILLIENQDDIDAFDMDSGKGSECWEGWAICNGEQHYNAKTKKNITTPNFTDRFIVQALGNYAVGDTGGLDEVTLVTAELPAHSHPVTDPGHEHDIDDSGHIHPIQDDMHTHQAIADPHHHHASLDMGAHTHNYLDHYQDDAVLAGANGGGGVVFTLNSGGDTTIASSNETYDNHDTDGGSGGTATGYTDEETQQITNSPAATGIEVLNALTGIDETEQASTGITVGNEGGGQAHENRPPYFAAIYVMKIS
jgi:microcystin-dependent protein